MLGRRIDGTSDLEGGSIPLDIFATSKDNSLCDQPQLIRAQESRSITTSSCRVRESSGKIRKRKHLFACFPNHWEIAGPCVTFYGYRALRKIG